MNLDINTDKYIFMLQARDCKTNARSSMYQRMYTKLNFFKTKSNYKYIKLSNQRYNNYMENTM